MIPLASVASLQRFLGFNPRPRKRIFRDPAVYSLLYILQTPSAECFSLLRILFREALKYAIFQFRIIEIILQLSEVSAKFIRESCSQEWRQRLINKMQSRCIAWLLRANETKWRKWERWRWIDFPYAWNFSRYRLRPLDVEEARLIRVESRWRSGDGSGQVVICGRRTTVCKSRPLRGDFGGDPRSHRDAGEAVRE